MEAEREAEATEGAVRVKINQAVIDELKAQCEKQKTRTYKGVEVDARVLIVLLKEIERGRLVDLRFERSTEPAMRD